MFVSMPRRARPQLRRSKLRFVWLFRFGFNAPKGSAPAETRRMTESWRRRLSFNAPKGSAPAETLKRDYELAMFE